MTDRSFTAPGRDVLDVATVVSERIEGAFISTATFRAAQAIVVAYREQRGIAAILDAVRSLSEAMP
jgi:hypothetical protein